MNQWVQFDSFPKGPVTTGQICAVYGVPVDWIVQFPEFNPQTQYLQGDIILGYQKTWLRFMPAATRKVFREASKTLKGRPYWDQSLGFKINWQSGLTHIKASNMVNHRWVFMVKEAGTGQYYVIGKPPVGAEIAISYSNEQGTVTEFSASFQALHRAPLYTGVNRSVIRLVDAQGNFIIDAEGNYVCSIGPAVGLPDTPTVGDFTTGDFDFTNNDFIVP
jgi:hypothetical protein